MRKNSCDCFPSEFCDIKEAPFHRTLTKNIYTVFVVNFKKFNSFYGAL